jgi:hypothetical protein
MAFFWHWMVRVPFAAAGIASLAGGAFGALDWSLSLSGLAIGALCADAAHHLGNHAHRRAHRKAAREALERAATVRKHMLEERRETRAA